MSWCEWEMMEDEKKKLKEVHEWVKREIERCFAKWVNFNSKFEQDWGNLSKDREEDTQNHADLIAQF